LVLTLLVQGCIRQPTELLSSAAVDVEGNPKDSPL